MLQKSVEIVASIMLIAAVGFFLRRKGAFRGDAPGLLSFLVIQIGMPCMTVAQLFTHYTRDSLIAGLPSLGIAYIAIALAYALSIPVSKIAKIPENRRGVFRALFTFGNTIFIGLPVNTALFGEEALPATLLYYIANTSLFWTLGASGIQRDGGLLVGRIFSLATLKKVMTPTLLAFVVSAVVILSGIPVPRLIIDTTQRIGNIVTPLSLFFIGTMLADMAGQGFRWERGYGWTLMARLVLAPGLILVLMHFLGGSMTLLYKSTFLVQASMPIQTSCAIVAHSYGADAEYATGAVTVSTIAAIVSIPVYAMLTTLL